jgi:hypothetical protein
MTVYCQLCRAFFKDDFGGDLEGERQQLLDHYHDEPPAGHGIPDPFIHSFTMEEIKRGVARVSS